MSGREKKADSPPCGLCGMETKTPDEYHPYAACMMFLQTRDVDTVRDNLWAVVDYGRKLEREGR